MLKFVKCSSWWKWSRRGWRSWRRRWRRRCWGGGGSTGRRLCQWEEDDQWASICIQARKIFRCILGTITLTKMDEFSENFQTFFCPPPPPNTSENYVALFSGGAKICNKTFLDRRDPTPPSPHFSRKFIVFPLKITEKICNEIFWIGNDLPFGSFPKIHWICNSYR